jgi:hypothetical protein
MRKLNSGLLTLLLCTTLGAQEKSSARDMYFGGLEGAPRPAVPAKPAAAKRVANPAQPVAKAPVGPVTPVAPTAPDTPKVPVINAVRSPLGLRYAILKMNGLDAVEVPPSTTFHSGERIQLRIQANADGYLYVVTQGSSGAWDVTFPKKPGNQGSNRVKAGEDHTFIFRFDSKPGVEKLFVVLSRVPERGLDSVIYSLQGAPTPTAGKDPVMLAGNLSVGDPLVSRLRNSYTRDMILEEVAAPDTPERAIFVVNKATGPDARVVADIKLTHE